MLNTFVANVPILYPLKTLENQTCQIVISIKLLAILLKSHFGMVGFPLFSGSIKWEHWPQMDLKNYLKDLWTHLISFNVEVRTKGLSKYG